MGASAISASSTTGKESVPRVDWLVNPWNPLATYHSMVKQVTSTLLKLFF